MAAIRGLTDVVTVLIHQFGWPGAIVISVFAYVVLFASLEQKRAIIDRFILAGGDAQFYTQLVLLAFGVLLFLAQRFYYEKRLAVLQEEINRLSAMKTHRQEDEIGAKHLHHTKAR